MVALSELRENRTTDIQIAQDILETDIDILVDAARVQVTANGDGPQVWRNFPIPTIGVLCPDSTRYEEKQDAKQSHKFHYQRPPI
jgi:hypothetical protein